MLCLLAMVLKYTIAYQMVQSRIIWSRSKFQSQSSKNKQFKHSSSNRNLVIPCHSLRPRNDRYFTDMAWILHNLSLSQTLIKIADSTRGGNTLFTRSSGGTEWLGDAFNNKSTSHQRPYLPPLFYHRPSSPSCWGSSCPPSFTTISGTVRNRALQSST